MARKKDLAGLATLAGLAYMASRDKEGKGPAPSAPAAAPAAAKEDVVAAQDLGEIRDEEGTLSKLRRNTETGETYDPTGLSMSSAPASKPAATRSVAAKAPSNPNYGNEGRRPVKEPSKLQYQSLQDRARSYEEERAKSGIGMYGSRKSKSEDMKKGGSVKGWGIARGSRKAKNY
jgi:hypothetical protein